MSSYPKTLAELLLVACHFSANLLLPFWIILVSSGPIHRESCTHLSDEWSRPSALRFSHIIAEWKSDVYVVCNGLEACSCLGLVKRAVGMKSSCEDWFSVGIGAQRLWLSDGAKWILPALRGDGFRCSRFTAQCRNAYEVVCGRIESVIVLLELWVLNAKRSVRWSQ